MVSSIPEDADREALRRLAEAGAELSKAMRIEFFVRVSDRSSASLVASRIGALGYGIDIEFDDAAGCGSVYCSREMLATYEGVVGAQTEINAALSRDGLECDGWGTFGQ